MRPAKTQISLSLRSVWSESSPSAWVYLGSLAIYWHTAKTLIRLGSGRIRPSDLSLHWEDRTLCLFCHAAAYIYIYRDSYHLVVFMVLGGWGWCFQLQVASKLDYRRPQSVFRSTDDFNFIGLIPRLILLCYIISVLLSFSFQRRST